MDTTDRPNRIPWPPIIYLASAAIGLLLHWQASLPWPEGVLRIVLAAAGMAFVCGAIALDIAAMKAFRRHKTTIMPNKGATSLITSGPFALSRNPIYVGNTLLMVGAGLLFGIAWLIPAGLIAAYVTQRLAIEREERHLATRFGAAWEAYAAKTPRWLIWR